jgi:hypothetical protein
MAERKVVPPFAEEPLLRRWWIADPPPDIYRVIKGDQLLRLAQLQVRYRLQVAQAQMEFYKELSAIVGR